MKTAAYNIDHPLVGVPRIILETDSSTDTNKALKSAASSLEKKNKDFLAKFMKVAK